MKYCTIGKSQLFCGDNKAILKSIDIDKEKCVFVTDPPFNIGYHYNTYKDKVDEKSYYDSLVAMFMNYMHVVIHYPESLYKYAIALGSAPEKVVSWVYNSNTGKQHRDIAFFGIKPNFRKIGQEYKNPTDKRIAQRISEGKTARLYDWWNINQVKNVNTEKTIHPCQMPTKVMEYIVGILPDDLTIVDPFMGSGTTAVACQNHDKKFIGMEIDELYYNVAKNRLSNYQLKLAI